VQTKRRDASRDNSELVKEAEWSRKRVTVTVTSKKELKPP